MSNRQVEWVWDYAEVGGSALLLLVVLATYADDAGRCSVPVSTLVQEVRVGERQITRLVAALESRGYIEVVHGKGRTASQYRITNRVGQQKEAVTNERQS